MMSLIRSRTLAILIICFYIDLTVTNELDSSEPTITSLVTTDTSISSTPGPTAQSSTTSDGHTFSTTSLAESRDGDSVSPTAPTSDSNPTSATSTVSSILVKSSGPASSSNLNSSIVNSQAPDELPIIPTITPGLGVAGVFLILSGAAYTLLGIRYKYLQVFFSVGYLISLAIAVLIIYVMSLPVSNNIQGGYVAAIIMAGIAVGGASLILVNMMQGLGCLLGGFTLSMWFLVLKPGGLITSRGGIIGLIAAITLAGFSTSFSHTVRPYALIFFISLSGSTVIVLGIDCFSRVGLKEFWVYLWNINNDLFAIGTTTYPISKGLYAEIAVIVVLTLAGIALQAKVWMVIKKKRDQQAAERMEDDKARVEEEAHIRRCIEVFNSEDRAQWEAAHGAKDEFGVSPSDKDSGVGDMDSQKKFSVSTLMSTVRPKQDKIETTRLDQPLPTAQIQPNGSSCNKTDAVVMIKDVKDVQSESEIDPVRKSIAESSTRSSYTSAKHLSNGKIAEMSESESGQEDPTQTMPEEVVNTMPEEAAETRQEDVTNVTQEETTNTIHKVATDSMLEAATFVNGKESQEYDMASENTNPTTERTVSQLSNTTEPAQSCSIQKQSSISSPFEPLDDSVQIDTISPRTSQLSPHESHASESSPNDCDLKSSTDVETTQKPPESPTTEDDLGPLPSPGLSTRKLSLIPFGDNTLMGKRDSIIRNKNTYSTNISRQSSTSSLPLQMQDTSSWQGSSGGDSVYDRDYGLPNVSPLDDDMPLSTRRNLLRQPSFPSNPTHIIRRQYSGPSPMAREQQLASFRLGIQRERRSSIVPNGVLERQRSLLWEEKQIEGQKKALEHRRKEERECAFDQVMRRGDMMNAHREAMRKMQAAANTHT